MLIKVIPGDYSGEILIPSSKSDSQRALVAAALSKGISKIYNVGNSADEIGMLQVIQHLGAEIIEKNDTFISIKGISSDPKNNIINCGESGLACRLLIAVCSSFQIKVEIQGEGSLLSRPMNFYDEILPQLNVKIQSNNGFLPISVLGPIKGSEIIINGNLSSQFLSGLLMTLPLAKENSKITVDNLKSSPYIEMTLDTLKKFGITINHKNLQEFTIQGNQLYKETSYTIENDWSSAGYWLVASALGQKIEVQGLSSKSLQADKAILKAFEAANCKIVWKKQSLKIDGTNRKAFTFDATNCPDLFPALASFAALTKGTSKIKGIHRLIHKESNRSKSIQTEFTKLGINVNFDGDYMLIRGVEKIKSTPVSSHNDHRIAMCLAILGMFSENPIEIENAESVSKSYPDFWNHLNNLKINNP